MKNAKKSDFFGENPQNNWSKPDFSTKKSQKVRFRYNEFEKFYVGLVTYKRHLLYYFLVNEISMVFLLQQKHSKFKIGM